MRPDDGKLGSEVRTVSVSAGRVLRGPLVLAISMAGGVAFGMAQKGMASETIVIGSIVVASLFFVIAWSCASLTWGG